MESMFHNAMSFNQPLDNWDLSSVTNTKEMFEGASSFKQKFSKNKSELKIDELKVEKTQIDTKDFIVRRPNKNKRSI